MVRSCQDRTYLMAYLLWGRLVRFRRCHPNGDENWRIVPAANWTITGLDETPWRRVAPNIAVPERFNYTEQQPGAAPTVTLRIVVGNGQSFCESVELTPASNRDRVTGGDLRRVPPVREMLPRAVAQAARRITFDLDDPSADTNHKIRVIDPTRKRPLDAWFLLRTDPSFGSRPEDLEGLTFPVPLSEQDRATVASQAQPRHGHSRQPIPMDDEGLRRVAELYRLAEQVGQRDPTKRVAREHNVSRMTASRWIRRARDQELLPPRPRSARR